MSSDASIDIPGTSASASTTRVTRSECPPSSSPQVIEGWSAKCWISPGATRSAKIRLRPPKTDRSPSTPRRIAGASTPFSSGMATLDGPSSGRAASAAVRTCSTLQANNSASGDGASLPATITSGRGKWTSP